MVDAQPGMTRQRPEQARSRQRIDAVLDATGELIAERGIEPTTITDIAKRAGMGLTALYRYFPNKQAIVRELAIRTFEHDGETLVEALVSEDHTAAELISRGVRAYWERNQHEPFRRNLRVAIAADADLAALDVADSAAVADVIGARLADLTGRQDVDELRRVALLTLSLLDGLIQLTAHLDHDETERVLDRFIHMVTVEVTRPEPRR